MGQAGPDDDSHFFPVQMFGDGGLQAVGLGFRGLEFRVASMIGVFRTVESALVWN